MADNEKLNQILDDMEQRQKNGENIDEAINNLFSGLSQRTSFDDLDLYTIDRLFFLIEGKSLTAEQQDIFSRIFERQTELTRQQPANDTPVNDDSQPTAQPKQPETIVLGADEPVIPEPEPEPVIPEPEPEPVIPEPEPVDSPETEFDFDNMTSYDLKQEYLQALSDYGDFQKRLEQNEDDESARAHARELLDKLIAIESYVKKELDETVLDEDNAPVVDDYVEIMTQSDTSYHYEHADELEQKLADYDRNNGLDGELPSAEEIKANEDKWAEITADFKYAVPTEFGSDAGFNALKQEDQETLKETLEIIRTMALTQLSLESPEADQEQALKRYYEKIEELSAQYLGNVNFSLRQVLDSDEEREKWTEQYLADNKITKDEWENIKNNPELYEQHSNKFKKYIFSSIYKTRNCAYAEKNAIFASRLARKTNMPRTPERAAEQKKKMTTKHPLIMAVIREGAKNIAWTAAMATAFGPIGITARQGWKLAGAFKKSWKNYKEQSDGKTSFKGFFKYLNNNREEAINLARQTALFATSATFTAAMAASGTLTFGVLGSLAGIGAQAATHAAAQTTIMGLAKYKAIGAISIAAGLGQYFHVRHESAKAQKGLTEILQKYLPEQETQKKGLIGKLFSKSPTKRAISHLTGLIRNGDEKIMAKLEEMAPDMSAQDKEAAMKYINQIKMAKGKSIAAGVGVVAGSVFMSDTAQELIHNEVGSILGHDTPNTDADVATNTDDATPTNLTDEHGTPGQETPEQDTQATEPANSAELHNFALSDADFAKATEQPNATYVILNRMGVMNNKEFDTLCGNGSHIVQSEMTDYLNKLQLTEAQQQEFQAKLDSGEFDKIADDLNHKRLIILPGGKIVDHSNWTNAQTLSQGNSVAVHTQGNLGNDGNVVTETHTPAADDVATQATPEAPTAETPATDANSAEQAQQTITVTGRAKKAGFLSFLHKKHEYTIEIPQSGNLNNDVENYAGNIAMQEYNAKHPDAPITDPAEMKKHGYSITGRIVDANGQEHKFKVKYTDDGNRMVRTIDGERTEVKHVYDTSIAKYENVEVPANTVGDASGTKPDRVLLAQVNSNGQKGTFVRDGDTGEIHKVTVGENGQPKVTKTDMTESDIRRIYRDYGRTR